MDFTIKPSSHKDIYSIHNHSSSTINKHCNNNNNNTHATAATAVVAAGYNYNIGMNNLNLNKNLTTSSALTTTPNTVTTTATTSPASTAKVTNMNENMSSNLSIFSSSGKAVKQRSTTWLSPEYVTSTSTSTPTSAYTSELITPTATNTMKSYTNTTNSANNAIYDDNNTKFRSLFSSYESIGKDRSDSFHMTMNNNNNNSPDSSIGNSSNNSSKSSSVSLLLDPSNNSRPTTTTTNTNTAAATTTTTNTNTAAATTTINDNKITINTTTTNNNNNSITRNVSAIDSPSRLHSNTSHTHAHTHHITSTHYTNNSHAQNGIIYVGKTNITSLESARKIRIENHGAEARKFDPAVIKLLAEQYSIGNQRGSSSYSSNSNSNNISNGNNRRKEYTSSDACMHNIQVAESAGFLCRAALFRTIHTLIPVVEEDYNNSLLSKNAIAANTTSTTAANSSTTTTAITTNTTTANKSLDTTTTTVSLPFATELIGEVLSDLLEIGDCQHFVIVCEILLHISKLFLEQCLNHANILPNRRVEAYYSYIELLRRFQHYALANEIIMQTDIANNSILSQYGVLIYLSCSHCGRELQDHMNMPWCSKCCRNVGSCCICNEPVRGLYRWCAVCSHGGHINCIKKWFSIFDYITCPSGCGHECYSLNKKKTIFNKHKQNI